MEGKQCIKRVGGKDGRIEINREAIVGGWILM
jgi:hypothetical protein